MGGNLLQRWVNLTIVVIVTDMELPLMPTAPSTLAVIFSELQKDSLTYVIDFV